MNYQTLTAALSEQKEGLARLTALPIFSRREEKLLDLGSTLAQIVMGIHGSGKTTLCLNVLYKSGQEFAYVNFADERLKGCGSADLNIILECLYRLYGKFSYLLLDEIGQVELWEMFANRLLRSGMHLFITLSNALDLRGPSATHLTGRFALIELYPLSFAEYCAFHHLETVYDTTLRKGLMRAALDNYLHTGGFPQLQRVGAARGCQERGAAMSVAERLLHDLQQRRRMRYKTDFELLTQHLLKHAPLAINRKELQRTFAFKSDNTVDNYLRHCQNAFLLRPVKKYSNKIRLRGRSDKIYCCDPALMSTTDDAQSREHTSLRFESVVAVELMRRCSRSVCNLYYFKDDVAEADFVICRGRVALQVVQVCLDISEKRVLKREVSGILRAARVTGCSDLLIINERESYGIEQDGFTIKIVPAYAWLLEDDEFVCSMWGN